MGFKKGVSEMPYLENSWIFLLPNSRQFAPLYLSGILTKYCHFSDCLHLQKKKKKTMKKKMGEIVRFGCTLASLGVEVEDAAI